MALFDYRAVGRSGRITAGRMPAQNERELENRLRLAGLELISSELRRESRRRRGGKRVSRRELINFCFHLEQTLRGGVLLTDALGDQVIDAPPSRMRDVISVILESVREGMPLSSALANYPTVFDGVFIGLVRAGEASGHLAEAFARIGARLRWIDELSSQVRRMLTYPTFTLVILLATTLFLLIYLVPQLADFIREASGGHLPLLTRVLLDLSKLLSEHWLALACVPFVVAAIGWLWYRSLGERGLTTLDRWKLKLPVVGPVFERIALGRFTSLLGLLYASGVPVQQSLQVCREAAGNRWLARGIVEVHDAVIQGSSLVQAFERAGLFPHLVLRMVRIGETTGELDRALANVSYFYNREITERIDRIQALVEPVLTVCMGMLLGWLIMAVLGPIYDMLGKMRI